MTVSAIYDATVVHRRHEPAHAVRQRLRLAYLDLDELDEVVAARPGWSTHPAPVWFRRRDYLDGTDRPLADALGDLVEERTGRRPTGPVRMLTQLRTLGWLFNPLTTYYVFAPDGTTLATLVLEISNTPWHERFWYVLDAADVGSTPRRFDKAFHVSPFLPMDLTYQCRAPVPDDRLALRFDLSTASSGAAPRRVFTAALAGRRVPLEAPVAVRDVARTATQTARVSAGIYAHAAALAVRRARFHRHPTRSAGSPDPFAGIVPSETPERSSA